MILVVASGSSGYYMVDETGRTHTRSGYVVTRDGLLGPRPGERPDPGRHQRYAGSPVVRQFWLPTGQVEELSDDQRDDLESARLRRDLAIVAAEALADRITEAAADLADLRAMTLDEARAALLP